MHEKMKAAMKNNVNNKFDSKIPEGFDERFENHSKRGSVYKGHGRPDHSSPRRLHKPEYI